MAEYVFEITPDYPDVPYGSDDYSATVERRERITRCRDCRLCERVMPVLDADGAVYMGEIYRCLAHGEGGRPGRAFDVSPDDFCAWGDPVDREDS